MELELTPNSRKKTHRMPEREPHPLEQYPNLLEEAAETIHIDWMKRNPPQEHNKHLHIDYKALPQDEKEKDIAHLYTVCELLDKVQRKKEETPEDYAETLAQAFGSIQHEKWRRNFDPESLGKERMKETLEGKTNINVSWDLLHPEWKKENLAAGRIAVQAYRTLTMNIAKKTIEEAAARTTAHLHQ